MPRKKTVVPDEQPVEAMTTAETGDEENVGQLPESWSLPDAAPSEEWENIPNDGEALSDGLPADPPAGEEQPGDMPSDGDIQPGDDASGEAPDGPPPDGIQWGDTAPDFPVGEESPFPEAGDTALFPQPQEDMEPESDDPEYGALLQELSEAEQEESHADDPLTLDPPPGEGLAGNVPSPDLPGQEEDMDGKPSIQPRRPRNRPRRAESPVPAADPRRDRVLTIAAKDEVQTAEEREAIIWHEIQNAHWTRRILTGTLDGVERTESGLTVAVVNYKGFRVAIPVKEMLLFTGRLPSGAEFQELMARMRGILTARLGSEIDFIVKGHENKTRSVVASRRDAMYRKRQTFYLDKDERGEPMIYEGHVVQADVRSTTADTAADDLKKCVRQGRYAGRVTDVRGGVLYVRLNNGVNAIAHSCYDRRTPGKGDDVSFAVTRLDEEHGVAVGLITRIIFLLLAGGSVYLFLHRKTVCIYVPGDRPRDYKLIVRFRVAPEKPEVDITGLEPYPENIVAVEIKRPLAKKLLGQTFTVRHRSADHAYTVLQDRPGDWHEFDIAEEKEEIT